MKTKHKYIGLDVHKDPEFVVERFSADLRTYPADVTTALKRSTTNVG